MPNPFLSPLSDHGEEGRAFLQARVALFWKVLFFIILLGSGLGIVGAVAYFLLAGADVFDGKSVVEVCSQHLYQQPHSLRERGVAVPADLDAVVLACLEKDPNLRPQSAIELRRRIEACQVEPWDRDAAVTWWRLFPAEQPQEEPALRPSEAHTIAVDAMHR